MKDDMLCGGDHEALVGYVYDECEAGERARVRDHLRTCANCEAEVAELRQTRQQLLAWVPPDVAPGVRFAAAGGAADRPPAAPAGPWWARPLPAWAQAAAAALVFATGVSVGSSRGAEPPAPAPPAPVERRAAAPVGDPLAGLEERIAAAVDARVRGLVDAEAASRRVAATAPAARELDAALVREIEGLLARSEERQRAGIAAEFGVMQDAILVLEAQQGETIQDLAQQRRALLRLAGQGEAVASFALR